MADEMVGEERVVPSDVIAPGELPPLKYKDLPEPIKWKQMIGPSILILGASIGSGEFVLWPYLTAHYGFAIWWACMLGILTQYFVNMEIERWTLATGECSVISYCRLSKHWAWAFLLMTAVPWAWPGWATGAASALSFMIGGDHVVYAILGLIAVGIAISTGPVVYNTVEKLQEVMVVIMIVLSVAFFLITFNLASVGAMVEGTLRVGHIPEGISLPLLLGAIAYAGAGGALNLAQSNYIRDKGYAMGKYVGRITSPITGRAEPIPSTGFIFEPTEDNMRKWRGWWKAANWDHLITFFFLGSLSLILLSLIAYNTVYGIEGLGKGFDFIKNEGIEIGKLYGALFKNIFWLMGVFILFTTELGVMDIVARVCTDIVKVNWMRESKISDRAVYFAILWIEIAFGILILLSGITKPLLLLVIGSCLNGVVMFFYSMLLLYFNNRVIPKQLQMGKIRFIALVWASGFYGYFTIAVLKDQIPKLLG
jgi:hypothetical protein